MYDKVSGLLFICLSCEYEDIYCDECRWNEEETTMLSIVESICEEEANADD